jgi:TatD DNase family protein
MEAGKIKYIDIHCHLDFPDYEKDFEGVLGRMKEKEVGAITIGTDLESSKRAVRIAEENAEGVWACIGVHPNESSDEVRSTSFEEGEFEKLVQSQKVVAIGECGLDYFARRSLGGGGLSDEKKNIQKEIFEQQIKFALKYDKPLMLHCRPAATHGDLWARGNDAYDDVLDILESYKKNAPAGGVALRGNAHFFAGNIEQAKRFLDLGFTMSFTGVITFTHGPTSTRKDSSAQGGYDEVIKFLPIDSIMSETDAPFVAPVPYRGKRNEPSYVVEVVKKMAEIKGVAEESMAKAVVENATRIFGIVL